MPGEEVGTLEKVSASLAGDLEVVFNDIVNGISKVQKGNEEVSPETPSGKNSKEDLNKLSDSTINSPEKRKVDNHVSGKDDTEYETDTDNDFRSMTQKSKELSPFKQNIFLQKNYWSFCTEAAKKN